MDSLNSKNQSATGTSVFSKHKFDRAEPDGAILIPESGKGLSFRKSKSKQDDLTGSMIAARGESVDGLDPETRRKRRMLRIGGIVGGVLAVALIVGIVVAFVAAPRREKGEEIDRAGLANWIEENIDYSVLNDLESMFSYMWNDDNTTLFSIFDGSDATLKSEYGDAVTLLTSLSNKLASYSGKSSDTLSNRLTNFNNLINERLSVYESLLNLIDSFHEASVAALDGDERAFKLLLEDENREISQLATKLQSEITKIRNIGSQMNSQNCFDMTYVSSPCQNLINQQQEAGSYLYGHELLADILRIGMGGPIDYSSGKYIGTKVNALIYDLRHGNDEEILVDISPIDINDITPLEVFEVIDEAKNLNLEEVDNE